MFSNIQDFIFYFFLNPFDKTPIITRAIAKNIPATNFDIVSVNNKITMIKQIIKNRIADVLNFILIALIYFY